MNVHEEATTMNALRSARTSQRLSNERRPIGFFVRLAVASLVIGAPAIFQLGCDSQFRENVHARVRLSSDPPEDEHPMPDDFDRP